MIKADRKSLGLSMLLEQTARAVYDKRAPADIHPGQWSALRYFASANRAARTVAGLAKYLGVTAGPASRAVKSLEKHGLVVRENNPSDRRSSFFSLTPEGKAILDRDPIKRLAGAISDMEKSQASDLAESLNQLYRALRS